MMEHEHATKKKPETKPAQNGVETKASAEGKSPPAEPNHQNDHAHMAADFRKRFWILLILTLPSLGLSPILQKTLYKN